MEKQQLPVLPLYQCHKKVRAAKIVRLIPLPADGMAIGLEGHAKGVIVERAWLQRNPKLAVGGYFVHYCENADDYTAYSPAEPFESGYTPAEETEEGAEI